MIQRQDQARNYPRLLTSLLNISVIFILTSCKQLDLIEQILEKPCEYEFESSEGKKQCYKNVEGKRYILEYHENSKVKSINEIKLDDNNKMILNGIEREYYESGKIKSECIYVNDELSGEVTYYYEDGNIENEGQYYNNIIVNESKVYYKNGEVKYYVLRDLDGNTRYHRKYSQNGKLLEEIGNGIGYVKYSTDYKNMRIKDSLIGEYFLATPPKTISSFRVIVNGDTEDLPIVNNVAISKHKFTVGTFEIIAVLKIKDKNSNRIKSDTLKIQTLVRK